MKVILLKNFKNIGKVGEIKEVSDGYANNFLFPAKISKKATPENIRKIDEMNKKKNEKEKEIIEKYRKMAKELNGKELIIKAKAKNGKLFGSIGKKEILQNLKKSGYDIEENSISVNSIREIGTKEIIINLYPQISAKLMIIITEE